MESLIVSVCRQLLFVFPFAWIFAGITKTDESLSWTMWTVFPITEILTTVAAAVLFRTLYKKKVAVLD